MDRWSSWILSLLFLGAVAIVAGWPRSFAVRGPERTVPSTAAAPTTAPAESRPADAPDDGPTTPPSASSVAPLPPDAPTSIRIGVIQFSYRGAELARASAPTKAVALARAQAALLTARGDFASAVAEGDPGSGADLGSMPRGVLEPEVEYVVFTLTPGAVHDAPLDTPRGYWLVRRLP